MKKIIYFLLLAAAFHNAAFAQSKVTAEKLGDKIEIKIDGNLFTNYILSGFEKYPFFYPVNGRCVMPTTPITVHSFLVVTESMAETTGRKALKGDRSSLCGQISLSRVEREL